MDRSRTATSPEVAEEIIADPIADGRDLPDPATVSTDARSSHVAPIAEAVIARSNGKYDAEYLRGLVADVAAEFDGAPVQDYVAVLVTKHATEVLRGLDALRPRAA